jgi:hypothetical protein
MDKLYQIFSIAVSIYCVVRALKFKQNPLFWGVFGYFIPFVAVFVVHIFARERKDSASKILDDLHASRNKLERTKPLPDQKPTENKAALRRRQAEIVDLPLPKEVFAKSTLPQNTNMELKVNALDFDADKELDTIPMPDVGKIQQVPKMDDKEADGAKLLNLDELLLPSVEELVKSMETSKKAPLKVPPAKEARPKASHKEAAISQKGFAKLPLEQEAAVGFTGILGCALRPESLVLSPLGMNRIKYKRHCDHCAWHDRLEFTFLFSKSQPEKNEMFICPSCGKEQHLCMTARFEDAPI